MLKIEDKKIKIEIITEAICDKCNCNIGSMETLSGNPSHHIKYDLVDNSVDGVHIKYRAGYGSIHDGKLMEITLCTLCMYSLVIENKGKIDEDPY